MKKTYADQCLERATHVNLNHICVRPYCYNCEVNEAFVIHSYTDVPELARRLKEALAIIRYLTVYHGTEIDAQFSTKADELEAPLEDK